ncbi:MAG: hypothetical protein M5U01_14325 [Ardenticatenaceae bacterium]|nr:hypothetical protein [Ardenticatenaceae bacterium]
MSAAPGTVVPITWTASDDEGLRSFDIQVSYDAGRTWHPLAQDLPGTARRFDWQTAPGSGFADVRLRVIAHDLRFQNSSATTGAGTAPAPTATPTATAVPATATPVQPTATPIQPTATPAPTMTSVPADSVSITRAEYTVSKQQLRVEATSTSSTATLRVYVTATGALIGTLQNNGSGRYSGQFNWATNPQQITVRSSLGGSATQTVVLK